MPVDCRMASPMVRYRVYWVIFAWPAWPSWRSVSSRGMTTASNCKMMLAVMYGIMPRANTDSRSSAPPLNKLTSWYTPAALLVFSRPVQNCTAFSEMPGVGIAAPSRNTARIPSVNSSFLRRSGVRKARMNAVSMRRPQVDRSTGSGRACPGVAPAAGAPQCNASAAL